MKTLFTRLLMCTTSCLCFLAPRAQVKKYPSTLLWRISGKGLSKPSYLFGTMHVTDRRVFNFSDSLYSCLERAEGYAMELDPDTAFTALFRSIFSEDTSGLLKDAMEKQAFSRTAKRMEAELGIPANKITKKQLWLYSFKSGHDRKADDMDAPIDTYLYNIARRQGKWVGGIEDLEDQVNLMEELGSKFDADALLSKAKNKAGIEEITGIYRNQDLNRIAAWTDNTDSSLRDDVLDRRNIKMARRMDSMAAVRSNFFAVGAAHLPGKNGIITLLRARGYAVEPILSGKKIAPENYTYKAVDVPWKTVQNDEKTYKVQMPGNPFAIHLPNDITMQCYADLGTGLLYFFMAYEYPFPPGNPDSILSVAGRNMARNGDIEKQEYVSYKGTRGLQIHTAKNDYYYRVRTFLKGQTLYMVMAGSEKKNLIDNEESERFFSSFEMPETHLPAISRKHEWQAFTLADKGFTLDMPGRPVHNKQVEQAFRNRKDAYAWGLNCYAYLDTAVGNYYLVTIRDARKGYYIANDTSTFHDTRENAIANGADIISYDTLTYRGYIAAKIKALNSRTSLYMQSFMLCRANRIYIVAVLHEKNKGDTAAIARYFNSFRLLDPPSTGWQQQTASDNSFTTWAPSAIAPLRLQENDTSNIIFAAYDSLSTLTYEIQKQRLPLYYWATSDSSFFADLASNHYESRRDSLIEKHETQNGSEKGMEYVFQLPASNNLKRLRIVPDGDSVYTIFGNIPRQLIRDANINRFYDSFRLAHGQTGKPWLQNRAKQLLNAIQSADSATAAQGIAALESAPFSREDLPLLHETLLHVYNDENGNEYFIYNKLTRSIVKLHDSSTLTFIARQYPLLTGEKEKLKYRLLSILAQIQTTASYTLLQNLLLHQAPKTGDPDNVKYRLNDSLALTASLFPALLPMSRDTLFIKIMPYLLMKLADSNFVSPGQLAPYEKDYYAYTRQQLSRLKTVDWDYNTHSLIHLLGWFNNTESNALLRQFLQLKSMDLREEAALALIRNKRLVAPAVLEKIAGDKSLRRHLYTELVKYKKEALFPALYHNQKSLSESELFTTAQDNEYDSISIRFAGERAAMYMGKKQVFYLYKLRYNNEEGVQVEHLSIAGPYTIGSSKLVTTSDITEIVWDDEYDPLQVNSQFNKVIREAEKNKQEKKQ